MLGGGDDGMFDLVMGVCMYTLLHVMYTHTHVYIHGPVPQVEGEERGLRAGVVPELFVRALVQR